jgi:hypothetical protein
MARQNKKNKKSKPKKIPVSQWSRRWLLLLLTSVIVAVSYAVVAANREPTVDVTASQGTATRDAQLQDLEIDREAGLINDYDNRYGETILLDSPSTNDVLKASTHGSL